MRTSVIGYGGMKNALLTGLWKVDGCSVVAYDLDPDALAAVVDYCEETTGGVSHAADADVVFAAVKPDIVEAVLSELDLSPDQTLVTIAASVPASFVETRTGARVARIMPNPAAETRDMAATATGDLTDEVRKLLSDVSEFVEVEESQIDIATTISSSGPVFVFCLIRAVTQTGIAGGLSGGDTEVLAAQTFEDTIEIVIQDNRTTGEFIDAVYSPNGTTIEGMEVLWDSDADDAITKTVVTAERRSKELTEEFADR